MNRCRSGVMVYLHGWKRETPRANPERTWRNRATRPGNHTCKASTSDVHQQQQEREDNERRKAEATAERVSSTCYWVALARPISEVRALTRGRNPSQLAFHTTRLPLSTTRLPIPHFTGMTMQVRTHLPPYFMRPYHASLTSQPG